MSGSVHYLEDLAVDQRFVSDTATLSDAEIIAFGQQFDPQPFHLDREAARESIFGELVASGWHTAAVTMRLLVTGEMQIAGGLIGLGGEARWPAPVRPGDTLRVHVVIEEIRPTRQNDRGVVTIRCETRNQRDETVQHLTARLLVPRRPADASPTRS